MRIYVVRPPGCGTQDGWKASPNVQLYIKFKICMKSIGKLYALRHSAIQLEGSASVTPAAGGAIA